jgi:hypothetical protein
MKGHSSLLLGAFVLAAAVLPQAAHAQDYCFVVTGQPFVVDFTVDAGTDLFDGFDDSSSPFTWLVSGGRGTNGRTAAHYDFAIMNPDADGDPGCTSGGPYTPVDWANYNGVIGAFSGGSYPWSGFVLNACGTTGARTGTITPGACPAPRPGAPSAGAPSPGGSDMTPPATAAVTAEEATLHRRHAAGPVSDAAALLAALPEGGLTYCYTNTLGHEHEGILDPVSDILSGTGDTGTAVTWLVSGSRGPTNRTIRHHTFTWQNPAIDSDPGCSTANGEVDWFSYNGLVSGSGPSYTYDAVLLNSCGSVGTRDATLTVGSCTGPRVGAVTPGPESIAAAASAGAIAEVTGGLAVAVGPNPFRTTTAIAYALAQDAPVRLAVYDVLGRQVALLVDEEVQAGTHTATFDGSSLPAGTYLYRLEAGAQTATGQVTLVR